MWRLVVIVLVAVERFKIASCASTALDPLNRPTRQLDFGDQKCCPCKNSESAKDFKEDLVADGASKDALDGVPAAPCSCGKGDLTPEPSTMVRSVSRMSEECLRSAALPEPKPLFRPEVGFASSVLETLRTANEEELREARSRAAARSANTLGSALPSTRKLPTAPLSTARTATITVKTTPNLGKPYSVLAPRGGVKSRLGGSTDNSVGSSMASSRIIPPPGIGRLSSPGLRIPKPPAIPQLPRFGSPKMSSMPSSKVNFNVPSQGNFLDIAPRRAGLIKASGSPSANIAKSSGLNLNRKLVNPFRSKQTVVEKLEGPNMSSLGSSLSKPKTDITAKLGILRAATMPKVKNPVFMPKALSKVPTDKIGLGGKGAVNTLAKLSVDRAKLKLTPGIERDMAGAASNADVKKVPLLVGPAKFSRRSSSQSAINALDGSKIARASALDPLDIGNKLLESFGKIKERLVSVFLGKSLLEGGLKSLLGKSSGSELESDNAISKQTADMDSASSNTECVGSSLPDISQPPNVQPNDLIETSRAAIEHKPKTTSSTTVPLLKSKKLGKLSPKLIPDNSKLGLIGSSPLFKPKAVISDEESEIGPSLDNDKLDEVSISGIEPEKLEALGDDECTRCNAKTATEAATMKEQKVFNCKMVCNK